MVFVRTAQSEIYQYQIDRYTQIGEGRCTRSVVLNPAVSTLSHSHTIDSRDSIDLLDSSVFLFILHFFFNE